MAKKPINMKFEVDLLARVDALGEKLDLDRTALFTQAMERALDEHAHGREPWWKAPAGGTIVAKGPIHVVGEKPSEQTIKREPTENALKRQVGFEHHAKQVAPVDVSSLAVAGWRENMAKPGSRLKPSKGK